jgi:KDO2-lipid IV(A) lauroyltransferase
VLSGLARVVAFLLTILVKQRVDIARQNLKLTWPSMADEDREILLKKHLHRAGMAIFETAIGWWAPRWRIEMIASVKAMSMSKPYSNKAKAFLGLLYTI